MAIRSSRLARDPRAFVALLRTLFLSAVFMIPTCLVLCAAYVTYTHALVCVVGLVEDCVETVIIVSTFFIMGCLFLLSLTVYAAVLHHKYAELRREMEFKHDLNMLASRLSKSTYLKRNNTRPSGFSVMNWGGSVKFTLALVITALLMMTVPVRGIEMNSTEPQRVPQAVCRCEGVRKISASTDGVWIGLPVCFIDESLDGVMSEYLEQECACGVHPTVCVNNHHSLTFSNLKGMRMLTMLSKTDCSDIIVFAWEAKNVNVYARALSSNICGIEHAVFLCQEAVIFNGVDELFVVVFVTKETDVDPLSIVECVLNASDPSSGALNTRCDGPFKYYEPNRLASEFKCELNDETRCACMIPTAGYDNGKSDVNVSEQSVMNLFIDASYHEVVNSESLSGNLVTTHNDVCSCYRATPLRQLQLVFGGQPSRVNVSLINDFCPSELFKTELNVTDADYDNEVVGRDWIDNIDTTSRSVVSEDQSHVKVSEVNVTGEVDVDFIDVIKSYFHGVSITNPFSGRFRVPTFNVSRSKNVTARALDVSSFENAKRFSVGYVWEVVIAVLRSTVVCEGADIIQLYHCMINEVIQVKSGLYINNSLCALITVVLSTAVASSVALFRYKATSVKVPGVSGEVTRYKYTGLLISCSIVTVMSIGTRLVDMILVTVIVLLSGIAYGLRVDDKMDSCVMAVSMLPYVVYRSVYHPIIITFDVIKFLLCRRRVAVLISIVTTAYIIGWFGPTGFVNVGKYMRGDNDTTPMTWVMLASLSSACRSAVRALFKVDFDYRYGGIVILHVCIAKWYALSCSGLLTMMCFAACSEHMWSLDNRSSIPHILYQTGLTSKLLTFKVLPAVVGFRTVAAWVITHTMIFALTELNALAYRTLMFGFSYSNVALVYKQYNSWRLAVARCFVADKVFRNVYWVTATTGAGKTTVDVYANFYVDDTLKAGVGFNVIDVDGCVRNVPAATAKTFADSRLSAVGQGGINAFLTLWIPVARKFVREQVADILRDDKRARLPTLVMVHVPMEGELLGLPLCNYLGHVRVLEDEGTQVAGARSRDVAPDVTLAFIKSDEHQNAGCVKIDWTDVQHYLAPTKTVIDVPLAIFPDSDVRKVFVKVELARPQDGAYGFIHASATLRGVPLVAAVREDLFVKRWGGTYVVAETFGDIQATIYDASRDRMYYDDIPLHRDGSVDWRQIPDVDLACVVYRMELPSRHSRRGLSPAVKLRLELMTTSSKSEAEAYIQRRLIAASSRSSVPQHPLLGVGLSGSGDASLGELSSHQRIDVVRDAEQIMTSELKAIGATGIAPTPPLGQYQTVQPSKIIVIQGKEWENDEYVIYKGKSVLPPKIPPRSSAVSPCPMEVGKFVELEVNHIPLSALEALRRYVPPDAASGVVRLVKHGDSPSRARNVRSLRGWAIEFTTEVLKRSAFSDLEDGVFGVELVANPFLEKIWTVDAMKESADAVEKYRTQTAVPENF